jgi:hypothetical protein
MHNRVGIPLLFASALLIAIAVPSRADLLIVPTFDSTIKSDPNASAIEATINQAIGVYDSLFGNNITVSIYFSEMSGGLGLSDTAVYTNSYSSFRSGLVSNDANPAAIAGLGSNTTNNPVTGGTAITVRSADGRAVGINTDVAACIPTFSAQFGTNICSVGSGSSAVDGVIGLNTSITFPPQPNGSGFSLLATVEHEMDEILGLGSALPNCNSSATPTPCTSVGASTPMPEDLFRFQANGARSSLANTPCGSLGTAFFSYSGSVDLTQFNNSCNGGDFGDWASSGTPQVQDAFAFAGSSETLGVNEVDALTAIGYTVTTPEPGTCFLIVCGLSSLVALRRRTA